MKVEELIKVLEKLPPTALVFVQGYEGGLSDIAQVAKQNVKLNCNRESYMGPHEESKFTSDPEGVILLRANNPLAND